MSFLERFRVAVRKFLSFQKRITKLGPAYYSCNERQTSCTRRSAQPRKGCPNCEFTIQTKIFRTELADELKKVKGTRKGAKRWPSKTLIELVIEVGSLASTRKDVDPQWPVITARLVGIYRAENAKMKAIEDFNRTASYDTGPVAQADPNEGEFD
jgi:hypothetical protein